MTLAPTGLSWTALLAAWQRGAFTVGALQDVALIRIAHAADALLPLSEQAPLPDTAPGPEATAALETWTRRPG